MQTYKGKDGRLKHGKMVSQLRYAYDPEKRFSNQVVIGKLERWATELPPKFDSLLTDADHHEFRESIFAAYRKHMGWAVKALLAGAEPVRPEQIWEALDLLTKSLEKVGYPRPSRGRGRPSKNEIPTPDDLIESLYEYLMLASEIEGAKERVAALPNFIPLPRQHERVRVRWPIIR